MPDDKEGLEVDVVSLVLEGPLRQDFEVAEFIAGWPQFEDFIAVLAQLYAEVEVREDVADEYLGPEDNSLALGGAVIISTKQVALLLKPELTLGVRLAREVQLVVDEAK